MKNKRPMVLLAILHIVVILIYDFIWRPPDKRLPVSKLTLEGTVVDIKKYKTDQGENYRLGVTDLGRELQKLLIKVDGREVRRAFFRFSPLKDELEIGERIRFEGRIEAFEKADNLGQFDKRRYYRNEGYSGFVKVNKIEICKQSVFRKLRYFIPSNLYKLRTAIIKKYEVLLGGVQAGTLSAMVLGDKTNLDEEIRSLYSDQSIGHLLAISGLHISLVGMSLYFFLKKMKVSFRFSLMIPLLFLFLYGSFTGFAVSTTRAVIMMSLFFLSFLLGRSYDLPSALAFSSIMILFQNHRMLYQAGFQLSFLAVIAIFYVVKEMEIMFIGEKKKKEGECKRFLRGIKASMLGTVTINLVLLPVLLWHYYEIALNGIFLNVIVIPLMSILVITGLLGGFISLFFINLATFLLGSTNYILIFYTLLCRMMEVNSFNKVILGRPYLWQIILYYFILFLAFLILRRERKKEKKKRFFFFFMISLAVLLLSYRRNGVFLKELGVGDGNCEVVADRERGAYLINCGSNSMKNVGKTVLIPFIKYHGWKRIKGIFLTSLEEEDVGGVIELLKTGDIKVEKIFLPYIYKRKEMKKGRMRDLWELSKERKTPLFYIGDGDKIEEDGFQFIFFLKEEKERGNFGVFQVKYDEKLLRTITNKY